MNPESVSFSSRFIVSGAAARRRIVQARTILRMLLGDSGTWVTEGVLGCGYPRTERAMTALSRRGINVLINLHETPHEPRLLTRFGMREVHLPVEDFAAPSIGQIERGLSAIFESRSAGEATAVHCGAGLVRTGTLLACYFVSSEKFSAQNAVEQIRCIRPGSIETNAQEEIVRLWEQKLQAIS